MEEVEEGAPFGEQGFGEAFLGFGAVHSFGETRFNVGSLERDLLLVQLLATLKLKFRVKVRGQVRVEV